MTLYYISQTNDQKEPGTTLILKLNALRYPPQFAFNQSRDSLKVKNSLFEMFFFDDNGNNEEYLMTAYFGFVPTAGLQTHIENAVNRAKQTHGEPMYILRDAVSLGITDELIETLLIQLVHMLPPSDKRDTMEKLSNFIKSTVHVLMKQLLGKDTDENVLKSTEFLALSTHTVNGQLRVGTVIPQDLLTQMKASFAMVAAGEGKAARPALTTQFKAFNDVIIKHYMDDFTKTLNLGMIKRKASSLAQSGITKAVHVAIDKLVPSLNQTELEAFTQHYDSLIYIAD